MLVLPVCALAAEQDEIRVEDNPYFVTLLAIGLREPQVAEFKALIGGYASDRQMAIERERRRREANLPYRIRRAHARIRDRFLKDMAALLDEDQFRRFPAFHDELDSMLEERESLTERIDEEGVFPNQT